MKVNFQTGVGSHTDSTVGVVYAIIPFLPGAELSHHALREPLEIALGPPDGVLQIRDCEECGALFKNV